MLGSALYYPHIDIDDPKWLRSAVLFWDEIKTIVPRQVRSPYRNPDTDLLWREGFLEPLRCDLHPELLDALGRRVVTLMDQNTLGRELGGRDAANSSTLLHAAKMGNTIRRQFDLAHIHPEKLSPELKDFAMRAGLARLHPEKLSPRIRRAISELEYASIHPEKMSPGLRDMLRNSQRLNDEEGDWLLVDSRFADVYMSALAALLAKETDLSALMNEEPSMGINLHALLEDVKPASGLEMKGALVSFTMEAIRVNPRTRIDKLLTFRQARKAQLAELSAQFDDIAQKIGTCESAKELEKKVGKTYETRVRPKLEALKNELRDNSIQSVWDGVQRAVTVSIPGGSALAYFSGFTGTALVAATAAITVTDLAVKNYLARNKTRRASPFTYLLDVERKFSAT